MSKPSIWETFWEICFSIKFNIWIFTLITLQPTFRLIANLREMDNNLKVSFFLFYSWELSVRQNETRNLSEQNLTVHWVYYFFHFDIYGSTRSQKSRFLFYCKKHRKRYDKGLFITPVFDEDESRCLIQYKNPLKFEFSIILQETNDHQY